MTRQEAVRQARLEMEKLREKTRLDREKRLNAVIQRDPRIGALVGGDIIRLQKMARSAALEPERAKEMADRAREEARQERKEIQERLEELGLPADYLDEWHECDICADTGYVGDAPRVPCVCFERRLSQLLSRQSESEQTFENFDETIFPDEQRIQALGARAICQRYADSYPDCGRPNLLLIGESGLGKTYLLNCIAHRLVEREVAVCQATAYRLFSAMRGSHFGDNSAAAEFQRMIDCPILLLDDLGSEPLMNNVTVEYLFMLLNERLIAGRHTVTATNLMPEDLKARYGERLMSRLVSQLHTEIIRLRGRDLRLIKRS